MKILKLFRPRAALVLAALFVIAVPSGAFAQTYTLTRTFTSAGGASGTATVVLDDSTSAPDTYFSSSSFVPAELISVSLSFTGLPASPSATTFTRADLGGFVFARNAAGDITDLNFWASANSDGYTITGITQFVAAVAKNGASVDLTNSASPASSAAPVPTMSEWAMILFGAGLAGAAALFIHRRRGLVA